MRTGRQQIAIFLLTPLLALPSHGAAGTGTAGEANRYVHVLRVGETLRDVAREHYGSASYVRVVELVNDLSGPVDLEPGSRIRVPSLDALLADEGVSPVMPLETYTLLETRSSFLEVEDRLRALARDQGTGYVEIPGDVRAVLREAAGKMWDVAMALRVVKPEVRIIPNRAICQLKAISFQLNRISYGALDPRCHDLDVVHEKLAWAICNLVVWARNGYRYR